MTLWSRTALRRPDRVSHTWRCAHQQLLVAFAPEKSLQQQRPSSTSHLFSPTRPRRRIRRRQIYGLELHPPGMTTAVSSRRGTCLLPPPAGGLLRQNPGKIGRSIQAVFKVVSASARFWDRGARCFVVRLYVLERLGEAAAFFGRE